MDRLPALAIFDLDNTLLNGDSDHAWGEFLIAQNLVNGKEHKQINDGFYENYREGNLNIDSYLKFVLQSIAGKTPDELAPLHQQFMQEIITPMLQKKALTLLEKHKSAGDYLLIITATNDFITTPIAHKLGVDDILASNAEIIAGRYTGQPTGTPCFQEGKVTRLKQWLKDHSFDLQQAYFYSDSFNDVPLLEVVGHPVAVDADEKLLMHAAKNHWDVISLRD